MGRIDTFTYCPLGIQNSCREVLKDEGEEFTEGTHHTSSVTLLSECGTLFRP